MQRVASHRQDPAASFARLCLRLILGVAAIDVVAVVAAIAMGRDISLVPMPHDLFADYFKFILSYPGGEGVRASNLLGLGGRIAYYQATQNYSGVEGLAHGRLSHLHATPLTTLFCLLSLRAMAVVQPALLFAGGVLALAGWWTAIALRHAVSREEGWCWVAAGVACYPAAMMFVRGNLYAGAAGLLIIQAMLMLLRRREGAAPATLLAIACCIRPNAVVFVLPLMFLSREGRGRVLARFAVTAAAVSGVALCAAHVLYPDYTVASFRAGLEAYHRIYVARDAGLGYGSSAFGGLKLLFGDRPWFEPMAIALAAVILCAAGALAYRGTLRPSSLMFLTGSAYTLGSTILADYHLLPFLAVLVALAAEIGSGRPSAREATILIASCLVLAPKNLWFTDSWSLQGIFNPAILVAGSIHVICAEWLSDRSGRRESQLLFK